MTILQLLLLAMSLTGRADTDDIGIARDALAVALDGPELLADREATARLLIVWAWKESGFRADAVGDHGAACGLLQLHELARDGVTCAAMAADRRLALRTGLAWMRKTRDVCGSVKAGLRAFADGSCIGSQRARDLVEFRCRLAGGC